MLRRNNLKLRSAYLMVELVVVVMVLGLIATFYAKTKQHTDIVSSVQHDEAFMQNMKYGIKNSFIDIIEGYGDKVLPTAEANRDWGWTKRRVSPLPTFVPSATKPTLRYSLDTSIGATRLTKLKNDILENYNGACSVDSSTNSRLVLLCPKLKTLKYSVGGGDVNSIHTVGTHLDTRTIPLLKVKYWHEAIGSVARKEREYHFGLEDIYQARRNISIRKINTIRNAMERLHNTTESLEIKNRFSSVATGGLHSMDDMFIGWVWKAFGTNPALINTICAKPTASLQCTNLNTNTIWRSSVSGRAMYSMALVKSLLLNDKNYLIDGFNNPIYIYPYSSFCSSAVTDWGLCANTAPAVPFDGYSSGGANIPSTPHISVIYTPSYSSKNQSGSDFGKIYVSY